MMNKENKKLITGFLSDRLTKKEKAKFLNKVSTDKAFLRELMREIELDDLIEDEFGAGDDDDIESDKQEYSPTFY